MWPWVLAHWFYLLVKFDCIMKNWCVDNACTMNDSFILNNMIRKFEFHFNMNNGLEMIELLVRYNSEITS
jgi:hypothetical protein